MGAFYLTDLDRKLEKMDVMYFRYMDDILILAPTRWKLKKAIRVLNQTFNELKLEKHPEKTLIGRVERGFDFIGYRFEPEGITLAKKAINNFINKALRLYEQEPPRSKTWRLGEYVSKWLTWAVAGLHDKNHLLLDGYLYLFSGLSTSGLFVVMSYHFAGLESRWNAVKYA